MNTIIQTFIMVVVAIVQNGITKETKKPTFRFDTSDFEVISNTATYIDKTLLIKAIFEDTGVILITTPRGFGKSTNLNMLKRFIEIEVDEKGKPKEMTNTSNYRLFLNNHLKICKREAFFNRHFGKYPVIQIDYSPLREIRCFSDMLSTYRTILMETFSKHEYLLSVAKLWKGSFNMNTFRKYIDSELHKTLDASDIKIGFKYLSKVLHRHFGKKVFVLIDEYDAFLDGLILRENSDLDKIIAFVQSVNSNLLKYNEYLDRALMTGVIRVTGADLAYPDSNIEEYSFLRNHRLGVYYGVTTREVDKLLAKLIENTYEREVIRSEIERLYSGYKTMAQNTDIYNMWSVLHYIKERNAKSYWCRPEHVKRFVDISSNDEVKNIVQNLLQDKDLVLDVSSPLTKQDISSLNRISESHHIPEEMIDLSLRYFFEIGYLTMKDGNASDERNVNVKLPNTATKQEFADILKNFYQSQFRIKKSHIDDMNNVINSVSPQSADETVFNRIYKALYTILNNLKFQLEKEKDFQSLLYVMFIHKFLSVRTDVVLNRKSSQEVIDILLKNDRNVSFIIKAKFIKARHKRRSGLNYINHMVNKRYIKCLDKNSQKRMVLLAICYGSNKDISIGYSKFLNKGDNLHNTTVISSIVKLKI